jgi:ADP-ribose pyrophosphatase
VADGRTLERRSIYRGRVVDLSVDRVEMPNGRIAELEVIRHPGATAMVPLTAAGEVLLVRQYRYATGSWLLEVPAGKLDAGEPPEECAARELEEELGFRPGELTPLGWIWTTPGFTNEKIWLYLARRLEPGHQDLQPDEVLSVESLPFDEAVAGVHRGEICDGKSVCALLRAEAYLRGER